MKKVYQYIKLFFTPETGKLALENRYTSYNLDEFDLYYTIYKNGVSVKTGNMPLPSAGPWQKAEVEIPVSEFTADASSEYFLNVEVRLRKPELWADAGYVIASEQFALSNADNKLTVVADNKQAGNLKINEEQNGFVRIVNNRVAVSFDKTNGQMTSLRYGGREMLHMMQGPQFNWYRSINNDPRNWQSTSIRLKNMQYSLSADKRTVEITTILEAHVGKTVVPHTVIYTVHAGGAVDVKADFHTSKDFRLPRLALQTMFSPSLENIEWYGRGPIENYRDRNDAAFVGLYKSTVNGMREYYVRAQSMGERTDTRWLTLTDDSGKGVRITAAGTFDFSALHYTDRDLWRIKYGHDIDLVRRAEVVLNLDCIQRGIGNASCGPQPLPEYEIKNDCDYSYGFRIEPVGDMQ